MDGQKCHYEEEHILWNKIQNNIKMKLTAITKYWEESCLVDMLLKMLKLEMCYLKNIKYMMSEKGISERVYH